MAYIAESRSSYNSENKHVHFSDYGGCSMACDDPRFSSFNGRKHEKKKSSEDISHCRCGSVVVLCNLPDHFQSKTRDSELSH